MKDSATGIFETKLTYRNPTNEELKSNPSILGVLEGRHFVPGGFSRNGRYYPEDEEFGYLWTEQLKNPDLQEKIKNRTLFGTIGHDLDITEKEVREGKVSHFTTNHEIRKTNDPKMPYEGYAESYILNTPVGQCLKTYYEAGCNFYTSTRADGDYIKGKTKKNLEGEEVPILNPKSFKYERNDFILNPGFLEANPKLKESLSSDMLQSIYESYNQVKDGQMKNKKNEDNGVAIEVTKDNEVTPSDAKVTDKAGGEVPPAVKGVTKNPEVKPNDTELDKKDQKTLPEGATEGTVRHLLGIIDSLESKVKSLESKKSEQGDDTDDKEGDGKKYGKTDKDDKDDKTDKEDQGEAKKKSKKEQDDDATPDATDVTGTNTDTETPDETPEESMKLLKQYKEIGSVESINKALTSVKEFFTEVGKPNEVREALSKVLESSKKSGIDESLGSSEEVKLALQKISEFFSKFGSMKEVENNLDELKKTKMENQAHKVSERTGLDYKKVLEHLSKGLSEKEIVELYNRINSTAADRYLFVGEEDDKDNDDKDDADYKDNPDESRLGRVIRKISQ